MMTLDQLELDYCDRWVDLFLVLVLVVVDIDSVAIVLVAIVVVLAKFIF